VRYCLEPYDVGTASDCFARAHTLHGMVWPSGAEHWPRFVRNTSEQFEARVCMVEVASTPSIMLGPMQGSRVPIAVAHGEGRAEFSAGTVPASAGTVHGCRADC
jgi:phosphoribosylformylglycinamidine (FGAM) synthase-like amidotransferase family enzyme